MSFDPYSKAHKLPREASDYLSLLAGCGDESQAIREADCSQADVHRWAREPAFPELRRQALEHFEDWQDWKPPQGLPVPDGQRFTPVQDLTDAQLREAGLQSQQGDPLAGFGFVEPAAFTVQTSREDH